MDPRASRDRARVHLASHPRARPAAAFPASGSRDAFASRRAFRLVATALDEDDAPADISGRDDDDLDEILVFDDGLDDPFEAIASPASSPVDAAFDAMLDDIVATSPDPVPDSDSDAASAYAQPGDEDPWPDDGAWPEFENFLGKLMAKGYSLESPNAPPGWGDDGEAAPRMSTPEWARAVASAPEPEVNEDADRDATGVKMDLADDPFSHVAHDDDDEYVELTYANKKRLLLEFSRDRTDVFHRLSERELYAIADHPMPRGQGNSGGRKQVNALKRLRAHLGVDDFDFRGRCVAADHPQPAMGAAKLSDVLRVVHVYAEDVDAKDRPRAPPCSPSCAESRRSRTRRAWSLRPWRRARRNDRDGSIAANENPRAATSKKIGTDRRENKEGEGSTRAREAASAAAVGADRGTRMISRAITARISGGAAGSAADSAAARMTLTRGTPGRRRGVDSTTTTKADGAVEDPVSAVDAADAADAADAVGLIARIAASDARGTRAVSGLSLDGLELEGGGFDGGGGGFDRLGGGGGFDTGSAGGTAATTGPRRRSRRRRSRRGRSRRRRSRRRRSRRGRSRRRRSRRGCAPARDARLAIDRDFDSRESFENRGGSRGGRGRGGVRRERGAGHGRGRRGRGSDRVRSWSPRGE